MQERQCMNGKCDFCNKALLDKNGEARTNYLILMKTGEVYNTVLGEWCSEECFTRDKKNK